jgi:hypothetical protein
MADATIVSLEGLKAHLGIPLAATERDDRLQGIVDGLNSFLTTWTGRDWQRIARTNEAHEGLGVDSIVLNHYPCTALTALTVDGDVWDVTDDGQVVLDLRNGILYRTDGGVWPCTRHRKVILVSYTGGPADVPEGLTLGGLELGAWVYQAMGGRSSVLAGDVRQDLFAAALTEHPTAGDMIALYRDSARGYLK